MPADKEKLRASLERSMARFITVADSMSDDEWHTVITGDEGWPAHDVVAHLMFAERGMILNARRSAAGDTVMLPDDFSLDRYNQGQAKKHTEKSVAQLREELAGVRVATLRFLDEVPQDKLDTPTVHPVIMPITVAGIFKIIAIHQTQHTDELAKAVAQARVMRHEV